VGGTSPARRGTTRERGCEERETDLLEIFGVSVKMKLTETGKEKQKMRSSLLLWMNNGDERARGLQFR